MIIDMKFQLNFPAKLIFSAKWLQHLGESSYHRCNYMEKILKYLNFFSKKKLSNLLKSTIRFLSK